MGRAIEAVLHALNRAGVRYLVVGGVGVVLHGHLRTTGDLDLYVQLDSENVLRAVAALEQLGFRPRVPVPAAWLADPHRRAEWLQTKGLTVFSFWSESAPGLEVDRFVEAPFDFDEAYGRAVRVDLDTTWATVASLEDLIRMKERSGRPRDLEDVEMLREIARRTGRTP